MAHNREKMRVKLNVLKFILVLYSRPQNEIDHGVRHRHMAAMGPHAWQQSPQQLTYTIWNGAALLKLEKIIIITINMTIIVCRIENDVRQRCINDEPMGAAQPT